MTRGPFIFVSLVLAACGCLAACGDASDEPIEPDPGPSLELLNVEAEAAAMQLGRRLKTRLMSAMQDGGPISAITVCADEAPAIAAAVSAETGLQVGRTAPRVRNSDNAPDAWEQAQLSEFQTAIASGADPTTLVSSAVVELDGEQVFRWAKPIVLEAQCATCHGVTVGPEILAEIAARYPEDAAIGFSPGDLRGMFSVIRRE